MVAKSWQTEFGTGSDMLAGEVDGIYQLPSALRQTEKLHPPNVIQVIKSRRWAGHVAKMEARRGAYRILVG
jgi:hypothetical protein